MFLPLALVRARSEARLSRADADPFVPQHDVAVADLVDAVARVAVAGVWRVDSRTNAVIPSESGVSSTPRLLD